MHKLRCLVNMSNTKQRYVQEGITLYQECKDLFEYLNETIALKKLAKASKPIFKDDEINNYSSILKKQMT